MPPVRRKLGEILLEMGVVDQLQLRSALAHHQQWGVPVGQALVDKRLCTVDDIMKALSIQTGLPLINLDRQSLDPALATLLPLKMAQKHRAVPLRLEGKRNEVLAVAIAAPAHWETLDTLRMVSGKQRITASLVADDAIERAIAELYHGITRDVIPEHPVIFAAATVDNEATFELELEPEGPLAQVAAAATPRPPERAPAPESPELPPPRPLPKGAGAFTPVPVTPPPSRTPAPLEAVSGPSSALSLTPAPTAPTKQVAVAAQNVWLLGWHDARERALVQMLKQGNVEARPLAEEALESCGETDVILSTTLTLQTLLPAGMALPRGRLIICGLSQDADLVEAKTMGAKMYLRPPFTSEQLTRAVAQVSKR